MFPCESKADTPNCSRAFLAPPVGADNLNSIAFNVVPAWLPWIPIFPKSPAIEAVSCKLIPAFFATGPTYFIVSPSICISTFAVVIVFAITSATKFIADIPSIVCSGLIPKPPIIFEAISAVVAKSVAPAVAKLKRPGIAEID